VLRDGLPRDRQAGGEVRGRGGAPGRQRGEDAPPGRVGQGGEDLLGNGLAILLREPSLVPDEAFVEEVLRYDSPVQVTTRTARIDAEISGTAIPAGAGLVLLLGAANRDPQRFPQPDRFDPSRTGNKPLSFGAGAHICLGNSLARLEATIAFGRLRERFAGITPAGEPARRDRLVLRGYQSLPVRLVRA